MGLGGSEHYRMMRDRSLTVAEFRSALTKGLGRAAMQVEAGPLGADYLATLVDACFEPAAWFGGDEEHTEWVVSLAERAGALEEVARRVLSGSPGDDDIDWISRRCVVLWKLAGMGNAEAKAVLYGVVSDNLATDEKPGWGEVLDLDGPRAFAAIPSGVFDDPELLAALVGRTGEDILRATAAALDELPLPESAAHALRKVIDASVADTAGPGPDRKAWLKSLSVSDVLQAARNNKAGWFAGWARVASDSDLRTVSEAMFAEADNEVLLRLLRIFGRRPLPAFDERLLELAHRNDRAIQKRAFRALAHYSDPRVRNLALEHIQKSDDAAIELLRHNYEPGDYALLEPFLADRSDPEVVHSRGYDVLAVVESNPLAELCPLVETIYEATPCSLCRERAVKVLVAAELAPNWMIEECKHDAFEDIRKLVAWPGSTKRRSTTSARSGGMPWGSGRRGR